VEVCAVAKGWIQRWATKYELLPEYITALNRRWQDFLWGESVIAVMMVVAIALLQPKAWVVVLYFMFVLVLAGYFAWRADHIRLMPQFEILRNVHIQNTPNFDDAGRVRGRSIYVQLEPRCLTDAVVEHCQGHLLRILHKYPTGVVDSDKWEPTEMNESLILGWSLDKNSEATLRPGVPKRLNVFSVYSEERVIRPTVAVLPGRWFDVMTRQGSFRFEIRLTAKDCRPVDVALECEKGGEWDRPHVRIDLDPMPPSAS